MKITGTSTLTADRATVWRALNDPAVLVATIPGCQRLEALGADAYKMTVAAGVGSIKGVYDGHVRLSDQQEPGSFKMLAQGAGAAGTIGAEVMVLLADSATGGTELTYDAEAVVGGMIGGVGQRMLTGVSRRMADEFFRNVDTVLAGVPAEAPAVPPAPASGAAPAGTVFTAPGAATASTAGGTGPGFVTGVAVGAVAALAGALVGGWIASRRR
jgi:carbon monoxide dehydrogenase subunit G